MTGVEVTPAIERAERALTEVWHGTIGRVFHPPRIKEARATVAAALQGDVIAEVLALHEDLVWQEPGEVFECVGCDYRVPGDEVEERTIRWHQQDMIRTELLGEARDDAGEADAGLVLIVLGVLGAVLLGAVVVAAAAGVIG